MKKTTGRTKAKPSPEAASGSRLIHIEYHDPNAKAVFIAGTFNDWHPGVTEMIARDHGVWVKDIALAPGRYEYRLVVDDCWIEDPRAVSFVENPYDGRNSVLNVD